MSSHHLWKIRPQLKQPQRGFPWKLNLMWPLTSGHTVSYHPLSFLAKHMTPCETVLVSYWLTCLLPHENGRSKRTRLFDSSLVHLQCLEQCLIHISLSIHIFEGAKVKVLIARSCPTFCEPVDCSPPGSSCPWNSPSNNTGVGCHFFLQGIFLIQESNSGLPHCRFFTIWATRI